jgi:pimeloyl-ACP methyl ester carboxylesterase
LFLCGRQDNVVGYHDALKRIDDYPRGSFVVLDAAGHMVHLEQPALTATAITEWLDRMVADGSRPMP